MLNLDDPFVRKTGQGVTLLLALMLAAVSVLGSLISIDYRLWAEDTGNEVLATLFGLIPSSEAPRVKDVVGLLEIFVAAIPAALVGVAVEKKEDATHRLNSFGQLLAILFGISMVSAAFAYLTITPEQWGSNHRLEVEGLQRLLNLVRGSLQASVFYLALLFGLRAVK